MIEICKQSLRIIYHVSLSWNIIHLVSSCYSADFIERLFTFAFIRKKERKTKERGLKIKLYYYQQYIFIYYILSDKCFVFICTYIIAHPLRLIRMNFYDRIMHVKLIVKWLVNFSIIHIMQLCKSNYPTQKKRILQAINFFFILDH